VKRTFIIAPQWIGDAVMTEPLLATLAARAEILTVAALPWVAPVYRAMPQVTDVIELPFAHKRLDWTARKQIAATLRGRFDVAYVLPNSIKAALIPWLARIPTRVGYQGEGRWLLLNRRLPNPAGRPAMVPFYEALADAEDLRRGDPAKSPLAHPEAGGPRPRLQLSEDVLLAATRNVDLAPGGYWAFAPGAEYGPAKRWPADHYAAAARSLHERTGRIVALLGSGKEAPLCEEISSLAPGACRVLAGKTSLLDAMALIAAARGVVSNDSGLMHVAAAFGVPQVAVFGSSSPLHTPPLNSRARVLWLKDELRLDCAPCFDRQCRYGHTRCLYEINPARVESALEDAVTAI
jgi:heptosyltransferase-2